MNITGYLLLQQGRVQDAVEAFRLNTEAYPESANAWDSFGDGYVAAGDKAKAAEAARRAIAVLDARKNHPERNDPAIRQNAEAKLK